MVFEEPLPDHMYSPIERMMIWIGVGAFTFMALSLIFAHDTMWDQTLRPIIWDPVVKDAGVAGDAGYTPQNTLIYTISMVMCVVILQAIFRKWNLPCDETMTLALIAWVSLAPVLRVLEDADFFSSTMDVYFISPIIHLHLAGWLILVASVSYIVTQRFAHGSSDHVEEARRTLLIGCLSLLLFFHWYWLYQPAYLEHEGVSFDLARLSLIPAFTTLILVIIYTRKWQAIPRGMLAFAASAIVLGVGHLAQFAMTPWAQESGRVIEGLTLWPIVIVIGIPALVCAILYSMGRNDAHHLSLTPYKAGVIPPMYSLKEWEHDPMRWENHPVEMLSNKALLAHPMVLGMVFGQLCDGLATMMGIDVFGYGEKHPVSNAVIQYGGSLNEMIGISWGEGAWLFALIKALLIGLIVWMFVQMRVEHRQQHFRLLVVLAVLIVGLAPGLRDIGRLTLGV